MWLVRHGETEANAGRITQGQQQGRLTRTGAAQAASLGARLRLEHAARPFDVVLCSDLLRCRQTCYLATRHWRPRPPHFFRTDEGLRERSVGIYEGLPHHAPRQPRPAGVPARAYRVPRGESWEDVNKRARRLLLRIGSTFVAGKAGKPPKTASGTEAPPIDGAAPAHHDGKLRVLVVTHGGFIMETVNAARGADGHRVPFAENGAYNTAIYRFELSKEPAQDRLCCRVLSMNDASHLQRFREPVADFDLANDFPPLPDACSGEQWWCDNPDRAETP